MRAPKVKENSMHTHTYLIIWIVNEKKKQKKRNCRWPQAPHTNGPISFWANLVCQSEFLYSSCGGHLICKSDAFSFRTKLNTIYIIYIHIYMFVYNFFFYWRTKQAAGTTSSHTTRKLNVIIGLDRMESEQRNLSVWWPCRIISVFRMSIYTYMLFCYRCCCCCFFFLLFIYLSFYFCWYREKCDKMIHKIPRFWFICNKGCAVRLNINMQSNK